MRTPFVFGCLFIALAAAAALAQYPPDPGEPAEISGTVAHSETGRPMPRVQVVLNRAGDERLSVRLDHDQERALPLRRPSFRLLHDSSPPRRGTCPARLPRPSTPACRSSSA